MAGEPIANVCPAVGDAAAPALPWPGTGLISSSVSRKSSNAASLGAEKVSLKPPSPPAGSVPLKVNTAPFVSLLFAFFQLSLMVTPSIDLRIARMSRPPRRTRLNGSGSR